MTHARTLKPRYKVRCPVLVCRVFASIARTHSIVTVHHGGNVRGGGGGRRTGRRCRGGPAPLPPAGRTM